MNFHAQSSLATPSLARDAVGAGLKLEHHAEILASRPTIGFFEIHAENYMNAGGPNHRLLAALGECFPLSVHGVGLSLGSMEPLDAEHLARLKQVVARAAPALVSEHLAWRRFSGRDFPDLLPLPYDGAALRRVADRIDAVQQTLGRQILIENPATYLRFRGDAIAETQFLDALCESSGCGLLLDVNNVHVSAVNHGFDATAYLDAFPMARVGEIHLAGHAEARDANGIFLIDDHGGPVADEVWALYRHAVARSGPRPTLIEWDNNIPDWPTLLAETQKARAELDASRPVEERIDPQPDAREVGTSARAADGWQSAFAEALGNPEAPVPALFQPCDSRARFAVYRNNSAVAAIRALTEQFPSVLRLVGDDAFSGLARDFARRRPPTSPILGDYGAEFPDFIDSFLEAAGARDLPFLSDVARFDLARLAALRAAEAKPCGLDRLTALDPAQIGTARARLHPSLALVASDWPLPALCDPETRTIECWSGGAFLVLRPDADARSIVISAGAAAFLRACGAGASFDVAAQAGETAEPAFDFGQTLVELTRLGAFADIFAAEPDTEGEQP